MPPFPCPVSRLSSPSFRWRSRTSIVVTRSGRLRAWLVIGAVAAMSPAQVHAEPAVDLEPSLASDRTINPVLGDASARALGVDPTSLAEASRIRTHLRYVHARLVRPGVSDPGRQAHRRALLEVLVAYMEEGRFPRFEADAGSTGARRPLWIDAAGRRCAVAHLVEVSGDTRLLAAVQRANPTARVLEMNEPALADWAEAHGFLVRELAMIQPTYDDGGGVHVPSEEEERWARERAAAEARVPRPLDPEKVEWIAGWFWDEHAAEPCLEGREGRWTLGLQIHVGPGLRLRTQVRVIDVRTDRRDRPLERCVEWRFRAFARSALRAVAYTVEVPIEVRVEHHWFLPTPHEVASALEGAEVRPWPDARGRQGARRACMADEDAPVTIPILVSGWNGQVQFRWDRIGTVERGRREALQCLQSVLGYGALEAHRLEDTSLTVRIEGDGRLVATVDP